jgi:hypothetical protein
LYDWINAESLLHSIVTTKINKYIKKRDISIPLFLSFLLL